MPAPFELDSTEVDWAINQLSALGYIKRKGEGIVITEKGAVRAVEIINAAHDTQESLLIFLYHVSMLKTLDEE